MSFTFGHPLRRPPGLPLPSPLQFVYDSVDKVTPDYYHEYYGCCPPPLFIPLISLVEIAVFIWYRERERERDQKESIAIL